MKLLSVLYVLQTIVFPAAGGVPSVTLVGFADPMECWKAGIEAQASNVALDPNGEPVLIGPVTLVQQCFPVGGMPAVAPAAAEATAEAPAAAPPFSAGQCVRATINGHPYAGKLLYKKHDLDLYDVFISSPQSRTAGVSGVITAAPDQLAACPGMCPDQPGEPIQDCE